MSKAVKAVVLATALAALAALAFSLVACGSSSPGTTTTAKLDKLTLVAPPGPMAIPMAYIVANNRLADVANTTDVVIWETADQLKAILAGGQGDFVTVPSNNAATFYNKGVPIRLLDISVWNITYLMTSDPQAKSFADIKGQSLVIPFQGSVTDVMFQYLATKEGLDPAKDFDLRYATDPTEAAQLLLAGQVNNAVLSEPLATAVVLQSKDKPAPIGRAVAFDKAWVKTIADDAPADAVLTPIAGVVATSSVLDKPEVIAAFEREYAAAVDWLLANPDAAGQLLETQLPQLGVKAAVMTASLKNITWQHRTAQDAKPALQAFYTALMDLSPAVIGGKLPDDAFYYSE
jgi:NitT/TauT family transport system substrate-binding protein